MAVAIPFIMSATGASAAIGAAIGISATAVSALTSVAFAVTGINDKINKAASKVFGEDLVKIGNLFGTAYAAFNGGFDIGGGEAVGKAALDGTNAFGANSVDNAFNLGDLAEGTDLASLGAPGAVEAAQGTLNEGDAISQMGGDANDFFANTGPAADAAAAAPSNVVEALEAQGGLPSLDAPASVAPTSGAASAQAAQAAPGQAAAPQATSAQATAAQTGPGSVAKPSGSFFDRLVYNKDGTVNSSTLRMGGNLLAGLGQGYAQAQAAKSKQDMFDAEMAERRRQQNQRTGVRITQ
jgi:hypothetical protein